MNLVPILQMAITPVILISGVGMLLLTMTNRLGRAIDRARIIGSAFAAVDAQMRPHLEAQLRILWRRAGILRIAIALASLSALAAAILVILLFFTALLGIVTPGVIAAIFIICLVCLICSLVAFIHDINQSLAALKLEIRSHGIGAGDR